MSTRRRRPPSHYQPSPEELAGYRRASAIGELWGTIDTVAQQIYGDLSVWLRREGGAWQLIGRGNGDACGKAVEQLAPWASGHGWRLRVVPDGKTPASDDPGDAWLARDPDTAPLFALWLRLHGNRSREWELHEESRDDNALFKRASSLEKVFPKGGEAVVTTADGHPEQPETCVCGTGWWPEED
jgi:hypothetical protein